MEEHKKDYSKVPIKQLAPDIDEKTEEIKKVPLTPVATGVVKQKKGLTKRLVEGLAGEDGVKGLGVRVATNIFIPAIKTILVDSITLVSDSITNGLIKSVFGEDGNRYFTGNHSNVLNTSRTNYKTLSTPGSVSNTRTLNRAARYGVDNYIIADRRQALDIIQILVDKAKEETVVSVADYYELISVSTSWTDEARGWQFDDIRRSTISSVNGGYVINFPEPVSIN